MQDRGDFSLPPDTAPTDASVGQEASGMDATNLITNIIQTHGERPIIKMIPDAVVYIDGLPYVINDYVGAGVVFFNINDFITSITGAADVNVWIPTCNITLSLPNDMRYLIQAPAGQRILKTMAEVKVFAKGYYLTPKGETVYNRVFWGVLSNVTYADNKKTLEVTLTCKGIMYLFDLMQINTSPSVITAQNNNEQVTAFVDKAAGLSALEIILQTFMSPLTRDVIDQETIAQNNAVPSKDQFQRAYATKWTEHLINLQKGVRIYGLTNENINTVTNYVVNDPAAKDAGVTDASRVGIGLHLKDEVERNAIVDDAKIRQFLPNYRIGDIRLLQSSITSRLARLTEMVNSIGWEGYQDLDGSIIVKPPLYNLDVAFTDRTGPNPFIIDLAEVVGTETETEDESQVLLTRLSVHGTMTDAPLLEGNADLLPHATFLDPGLVRQFGLRQEPSKYMPMTGNSGHMLYGYAVSELTKMNRRWRTYTVTIPFRPELKVGFPVYVPHLDIYAYLENLSWTYTRGSAPTMTLSCTNVRVRELFASEKITTNPDGATYAEWIYTSIPNLEWVWTVASRAAELVDDQNKVRTNPIDSDGTQPAVEGMSPTPQQIKLIDKGIITRPTVQTASDDKTSSWRLSGNQGHFDKAVPVDKAYYDTITHTAMPYTDGKGYVVLRPFPWGRFVKLEQALDWFTRAPERRTAMLLPYEAKDPAQETEDGRIIYTSPNHPPQDAFLMSALGTPTVSSTDPTKGTPADEQVMTTLKSLKDVIEDDTVCFTLNYDYAASNMGGDNPFNGSEGADQLQPGGVPKADDPKPTPSPIAKATAFVNSLFGDTSEGNLLQ